MTIKCLAEAAAIHLTKRRYLNTSSATVRIRIGVMRSTPVLCSTARRLQSNHGPSAAAQCRPAVNSAEKDHRHVNSRQGNHLSGIISDCIDVVDPEQQCPVDNRQNE